MNLVVLILNDNAYGMIKWKQAGMGLENYGLDFKNPDFVRYAQSYGAHGHRIMSATDLVPVLEECLATPGVHVVDCPVDYADNDRVLNNEIKERSRLL